MGKMCQSGVSVGTRTRWQCITTTPLFPQLVLDGNVLDIAMRYRADVLVLDNVRNNENFHHAAYRQFVLWQHGHLGKGNRRVVPSCCVTAIRARYPPHLMVSIQVIDLPGCKKGLCTLFL